MVKVSVVIPVYNVEKYIAQTIESVLAQTYQDFEIIIVDDGSVDQTLAICQQFNEPRLQIIQQKNRGASSARNRGIRYSQGEYIALLDGDDKWLPEKLEHQVQHLETRPELGVSFCRAAFMDDQGKPLGIYQMPQLTGIDVPSLLKANAIGSGSTPVIRRAVFEAIQFQDHSQGEIQTCYFDESLQRSEDLECWIRILLQTDWKIEGISNPLVFYRINPNSLSSNVLKEHESWEEVVTKVRTYAPDLIAEIESLARAHQLRYLSRRAIRLKDGNMAVMLINQALISDWHLLIAEPRRTLLTIVAAYLIKLLPPQLYDQLEKIALKLVGRLEERLIRR